MATYDLTSVSMPDKLVAGDILNCPYSGRKVSIALPPGKYKLECWGAQGGYRTTSSQGGKGGYSVGTLELSNLIDVFLYAGGAGGNSNTNTNTVNTGGFNGGGYRYGYPGGGGASDIRLAADSLYARVIVAGGGGSDGATNKPGGYGGGTTGQSRSESYSGVSNYGGKGGNTTYSGYSSAYTVATQATTGLNSNNILYYGGGFGFGGGGVHLNSGYGGAGGGGWYGGSGNVPDGSGDDDRGGGGGSGYVYTTSTASQYPEGCMLTANCYLLDARTVNGNTSFVDYSGSSVTGHSGNGAVRITVVKLYTEEETGIKIRKEKIRIQQKGDSSETWNPNYILMRKEIGIETDTNRMKIGNGITPWAQLPYTQAEEADKLTEGHYIQVNLASTSGAVFDGSADITPGVMGTLPVNHGGTGATSASSARSQLGVPPTNHATSSTTYGVANSASYGHIRTAGMTASSGYAQMRKASTTITNFNDENYSYPGEYPIAFTYSTSNLPHSLEADTGISSISTNTFYGILITYNYTNNGYIDKDYGGIKQVLVIPNFNLTYERYLNWDDSQTILQSTNWKNTSQSGAPLENIDFANKGGGRLYYLGRQPIPELEKAFQKPDSDTGTYLGQLSKTMGGWHVTISASIPTITIKRYNADKTQSSTKTITVNSAYGTSQLICMDKDSGRIFVIFYQATNYPYGGAVQFQLGGAAIDSAITQEAVSSFSASNWNSSGSERRFNRCIAFNNTCFFTTTSGNHEGNYAWDDYVCLSKITSTGSVSSGISRQGYYNGLYTNGTDLYVEYEDDASTSSYPTRYYEYIFKYPNGDLSNSIELWNDTYYSDDKWDVEMYIPHADKFILENREKNSDSWNVSYYSVSNSGTRTSLSTGGNIITIIGTSENYMIIQLQGAYDGWAYKETGNGIGLVNLSTGQLDFIDIYCNSVLPYARFDENTNNFYIGTKDNYEFIYTIV